MNLWAQDIYSCDGNVIVLGTFLFYFFFSRTGTPFCPVSQDVLNISWMNKQMKESMKDQLNQKTLIPWWLRW